MTAQIGDIYKYFKKGSAIIIMPPVWNCPSTDVDAAIKSVWFRLSRREDDFCVENSFDGIDFKQMRICHMFNAPKEIRFGIYACSAEDSSFLATFTDMEITECAWKAHDGQQPDKKW